MEREFNMEKAIVFLGPSLPLEEAKRILPDACYLPPVRCGDILRVLRLNPTIIVIIDGYFENTPAVWHKEILFALEKGIAVMGSSSMGALRASELHQFGMITVGKVANEYKDASIIDDDEVAILHSSEQSNYRAVTDAMVNIKATLEKALSHHVIDDKTYLAILKSAKQLFYHERTLNNAIKNVIEKDVSKQKIKLLKDWLDAGNYVDVKKEDAILLLKTIANHDLIQTNLRFKFNRPAFFRALHKNVMCRPFSSYQNWLPIQEKVALFARYLGDNYKLVRQLAYLLSACYGLAVRENINPTEAQKEALLQDTDFGFSDGATECEWNEENDCSNVEKQQLMIRLARIKVLIEEEKKTDDLPGQIQDYLLFLMRTSGDYVTHKKLDNLQVDIRTSFKEQEPLKFQLTNCVAHCWWLIERQALRLKLQPNVLSIQEYSDKFRFRRGLHTQSSVETWLLDNELDLNVYQYFMTAHTRLSFLVFQNNLDVLGVFENDKEAWWLLDALRLSGFYSEAKDLLTHPKSVKELQVQGKKKINLEQYAFSLDFMGGEEDFLKNSFQEIRANDNSVTALTTD